MRTVFMGTPDFAVPSLRQLATQTDVVAVYTQPDRPQGRGLVMTPPPVKRTAEELNLPVFQPRSLRGTENLQQLQQLEPELIVVVAYAQLLTSEILTLPRCGCINVHASLLPAYRGGAPIHWAIVKGETETGVTTMLMDTGLDTGDMLLQKRLPIGQEETCGEVHDRLAALGAEVLSETLTAIANGCLQPVPQPTVGVSYARNLTKGDGDIVWQSKAQEIHNLVRGLNPWPVAHTWHNGRPLRVFRTRLLEREPEHNVIEPGGIVALTLEGPVVQTGEGGLLLQEVQPANKGRMSGADYARGHGLTTASRLGTSNK